MKKSKKKNKTVYEENPWEDNPTPGKPIKNFFSPAELEQLKTAPVRVIRKEKSSLPLPPQDLVFVQRKAQETGLSTDAFLIGLIHDFTTGRLIRT